MGEEDEEVQARLYTRASKAISEALMSSDPTCAVLGAIALHLQDLSRDVGPKPDGDGISDRLESIENAVFDENGRSVFYCLRDMVR